ncbi:MAG: efflux transporter outer membrane subunit [Geobacter sp.]|nr:efflux transporter outer membrane subunit [Geobacter sp.]
MTFQFRQRIRCSVGAVLIALLAGGCSLLPHSEYATPQVDMPQQWQGSVVTGAAIAAGDQWWRDFNDPLLNELIDRALRTNNDLAAATIKVQRARLQSQLTDTNLTPTVSVAGNAGVNRDLKQEVTTHSYSVSGSLSYELDLWGKLARTRDASSWEAEATDADRENTALSLIGTTATAYWQVAYLNQRIASSEASLAYTEQSLALTRLKHDAGAVTGLDLVQAQQSVASQKAALTQLRQQRTAARHALAILFDQAPQHSLPELQELPDGPIPAVAAGLPAGLLGRRPDLRAAELRLRETLANVDVAKAGFYPAFTLTGSLGGSSTSLADVLQNPVAALGIGLTLPFVQWNTAQLTIKVAQTQYEEAVVQFRQTLYKALADVEDALSATGHYRDQGVYLKEALACAIQAEQLAEARYRAGGTGVQAWLDEQERRRTAELNLAENRFNRLTNIMKLYQALGGDMRTTGSVAAN